ncbi:hypothetical protein B0T10DRAFT_460698 [Thelonectria olida]|uniref:Uncharacterized protein n=1 Tax=Thelonectria olida TaxID=1576542 RepID=A0A9P8W3C8_9HYPO|nr:hypothetical protein B0T10DRAFT_460698 [Thelonectria olida]
MNFESSNTATQASDANASNTQDSQVTYTTAGTRYDPSSSQPLQAPARRGRMRWTVSHAASHLEFLPRSSFDGIQLGVGLGRNSSVQSYAPLQQNNDRAMSPVDEADHASVNTPAEVTKMSSDTPISFSSMVVEPDDDQPTEVLDNSEPAEVLDIDQLAEKSGYLSDDEYESDTDMGVLMNMSVKTLQSLASYENPNQRKAQRVLDGRSALPVKPDATNQTDSQFTGRNRVFNFMEMPQRLSIPPAGPASSDPPSHHPGQGRYHHLPILSGLSPEPIPESSHRDEMVNWETSGFHSAGSSSINPSAGPPPLTAGPPGHRQYQPKTRNDEVPTFSGFRRFLYAEDGDSTRAEEAGRANPKAPEVIVPKTAGSISPYAGDDVFADTDDYFAGDLKFNPESSASHGFSEVCRSSWSPLSPFGQPYRPKTPLYYPYRSSAEVVRERNERIQNLWYAGAGFLPPLDKEQGRRNKYGAAGDGRPVGVKVQSEPKAVAEASQTPTTVHAQRLLEIAHASVLRQKQSVPSMDDDDEM